MPDFDHYYADVPAEQRNALQHFRETHTLQNADINGTTWQYYDIGTGETVILWLVGGLRVADAAYRSIPLMETSDAYRIIAPDYPPLENMAALADGLAGLITQLKITQVNVLSGSFGGMLAQVLVRRHPQLIKKLILSTTAAPSPDIAERYTQQLAMIAPLDESTIQQGAKMQMLETLAPSDEERAFWRAYLDELYTERLDKAHITTTYQCLIDYMQNYEFASDDLADFTGDILIFDSDNDATFGQDVQASLTDLYPQAQRHTFIGAGHSPGSTRRDEFFQRVRDFLD
ncbi:MAG: alpha/beta fold hydrolase [Aggregatilineales bacterium]